MTRIADYHAVFSHGAYTYYNPHIAKRVGSGKEGPFRLSIEIAIRVRSTEHSEVYSEYGVYLEYNVSREQKRDTKVK